MEEMPGRNADLNVRGFIKHGEQGQAPSTNIQCLTKNRETQRLDIHTRCNKLTRHNWEQSD